MENLKNYTVEQMKKYYDLIKQDGINPNVNLFKEVPDYDLVVSHSKMRHANEDDHQKMLLWVICKQNITEQK